MVQQFYQLNTPLLLYCILVDSKILCLHLATSYQHDHCNKLKEMLKPYKRRQIHYKGTQIPQYWIYLEVINVLNAQLKQYRNCIIFAKTKIKCSSDLFYVINTNFKKVSMLYLLIFAWYNNSQSKCVKVK